MSNFDPTLPVQTRDGRKTRILCIDAVGDYPVVALAMSHEGQWEQILRVTLEGWVDADKRAEEFDTDLINTPPIPKGLRGLSTDEDTMFSMKYLIDYLDKEHLVVMPKTLTADMAKAVERSWSRVVSHSFTYTVAIKAWEEENE